MKKIAIFYQKTPTPVDENGVKRPTKVSIQVHLKDGTF